MLKLFGSFYFSRIFIGLPRFLRKIIYEYRLVSKQPTSVQQILHSMDPGLTILDLGANLGLWSDYFLVRGLRVLAVEPDPGCLRYLRGRFCADELQIVPRAVSVSSGLVKLYIHEARQGLDDLVYSQSSSILPEKMNNVESTIYVETISLNELVMRYNPTYVKMDVEGAELDILCDFISSNEINISEFPIFLVELHNRNVRSYDDNYKILIGLISKKNLQNKFNFEWR